MNLFRRDHGSPDNRNLASWIPLAIAVLSAMAMALREGGLLRSVIFIPGHPDLFGEWWRFLTYPFFTAARPLSLLFTTLFLWWVSIPVEEQHGSLSYLLLFFVAGIGAAFASLLINALLGGSAIPFLLGPEAVLWAATWIFSRINPDHQFYFMFVIPVKARWFPLLFLGARILLGGLLQGGMMARMVALTIAAELLGAALGLLFLRLAGARRAATGRRAARKDHARRQEADGNARKAGEKAAAPLLALEARLAKDKASDTTLLETQLKKEFDFTVCPPADFGREDVYCKNCPAYTHCLAREIKNNQDS